MKKYTTGKKPVKKIPRADPTRNPSPEMLRAATTLRKLVNHRLRSRTGYTDVMGLFALADYAEKVVGRVTVDRAMSPAETPDPAEVAFQIRVYSEAMKHFAAFATLLAGLVDTGPSVRWVDAFGALRLMWSAELLHEQLKAFRDEMEGSSNTDNAMAFEESVRLAVRGMGPPFGPARDGG